VELWSYDVPTDYSRTERGLDAVYAALHQRTGVKSVVAGETDTWLVQALWGSTSRDLADDVLRASVRYATYTLVTNTP
jgi:glycine cleavage system aminomethyltransferase T